MAYASVPVGRYVGWTAVQLNARITAIRTAMLAAPVNLAGTQVISSASGNGTSVTFDTKAPGSRSLEEELYDLQLALAMVDDNAIALPTSTRFAA